MASMNERLGRYELIDLLATGGMAQVYLARMHGAAQFQKTLVIKRVLPELAREPEIVARFLDEARLGAKLDHPCIVQILDLGEVGGSYFIAMEHVDGPSLSQLLSHCARRQIRLPAAAAVHVLACAAEGLDHAHRRLDPATGAPLRLVHRDVSPQNILLSWRGEVKVTDFGVAKSTAQAVQTRSGVLTGKVAYMSPEQIVGKPVDARSDVFGLGIVLHEALTLRRLFKAESEFAVMRRIVDEDVRAPSNQGAGSDASLDTIVLRALARNRDQRLGSARELAEALGAWLRRQALDGKSALRELLEHERTAMQHRVPSATPTPSLANWTAPDPATVVQSTWHAQATETQVETDAPPSSVRAPAAGAPPAAENGPRLRPLRGAVPARGPQAASDDARELVLYVEDDDGNWQVAELSLRRNFRLLRAATDREACDLVRRHAGQLIAVLMDIQLQGSRLDGTQLTRLLRGRLPGAETPDYAQGLPPLDLPIFYVTAHAGRFSQADLDATGADKVLTKPVNFAQLTLALASHHLRRAVR